MKPAIKRSFFFKMQIVQNRGIERGNIDFVEKKSRQNLKGKKVNSKRKENGARRRSSEELHEIKSKPTKDANTKNGNTVVLAIFRKNRRGIVSEANSLKDAIISKRKK